MNKITKLFLFIILFSYSLNAQLVVGESGSIEVKNGASIEVAGLEISPAADYVINSSTSVTSDLAPLTINGAESMDRHYDIVAPLSDFIGTIVFNYNEEDMNGISHIADLQVVDSEGGTWMNYSDMDDTDFSVTHTFESSVNIHSVTASAIATITPIVAPWSDDFEDGDVSDWTQYQAADASTGWTLLSTGMMNHTDDNVATGVDNYFISPLLDCTGLTAPLLTYTEYQTYSTTWYDYHSVSYSTDYDGTNAATATWTELVNGSAAIGSANAATLEFAIPNTATAVAFRYMGDYADNWFVDDVSVTETPTDPAMEVSATTDGGSATFSFALENFTVGAAAGEGDGHIHYSLNGGAEVMVYSTDDLTLSDLPNGDHTIVFSLVDANHVALDPAVEATVEFSTFDGTAACDETVTYTQINNNTYTVSVTSPEGQNVSVPVNGQIESGWDNMFITDSAGNTVNTEVDGVFTDAVYQADGTMTITVITDSSTNYGPITFAFSCAVQQTAVTFNVDMSQYGLADGDTVHVNGEFTGWCGDCGYNVMSDDDGDGIYSLTLDLDPGSYFWKYTVNGWNDQESFSEAVDGCTVNNNGNFDRQVVVGTEALEVSYCFNTCEAAGSCPVPPETYDITFSVDPSNYNNGEGIADTDQLYVSGSFNGWSGDANPMSDDDGDGIWEVTIAIADGTHEYKFTMNNWAVQEEFGSMGVIEGCTVSADGVYTNRSLTVAGQDMVLPTVYWNLCPGETPGEVYNITFNLDATGIDVGPNGMFMGGGVLGGSNAVPMTDENGDGVWTVTIELSTDQIGLNYTYVNSPDNDNDYDGKKEDISGQDCADGQWSDRMLPEFSGDAEFCYVFAVCTDGSCEGFMSTTDTEILDMRIYPNPVDSNYVTIQSPVQGLKEIEVYTVTGRKVLQTVLTDDQLDVSSFNSGFYMVKVTINGQSKLSKLVVR